MSDIVKRLRQHYLDTAANYATEAADRIETLERELAASKDRVVDLEGAISRLMSDPAVESGRLFHDPDKWHFEFGSMCSLCGEALELVRPGKYQHVGDCKGPQKWR